MEVSRKVGPAVEPARCGEPTWLRRAHGLQKAIPWLRRAQWLRRRRPWAPERRGRHKEWGRRKPNCTYVEAEARGCFAGLVTHARCPQRPTPIGDDVMQVTTCPTKAIKAFLLGVHTSASPSLRLAPHMGPRSNGDLAIYYLHNRSANMHLPRLREWSREPATPMEMEITSEPEEGCAQAKFDCDNDHMA